MPMKNVIWNLNSSKDRMKFNFLLLIIFISFTFESSVQGKGLQTTVYRPDPAHHAKISVP